MEAREDMKRKLTIVTLLKRIGFLFLLAAILLFFCNLWHTERAQLSAEQTAKELEQYRSETALDDSPDGENQRRSVPGGRDFREADGMAAVELENGITYIGNIRIPAISLDLPVTSDCSCDCQSGSPCRCAGSARTDDLVIAGYHYHRHFGQLKWLNPGDLVQFVDMDNNVYSYIVRMMEIPAEERMEERTEPEFDLTLFSCSFQGRTRIAIGCDRLQTG